VNNHEHYIKRCVELAKNGFGTTYPNPMVGSVIVHDGKIIGEGWHRQAGEAHAEVNAIAAVKDKSLLAESTIYVSLEPCNHYGKTPPCSDLILKNKIKNIVIGTVDSYEKVAGSGIEKLKNAGCNVTVGVLEKECQELNKRFFTFHNKKRPYIILKWAESQDGFIAPLSREKQNPVWLSNEFSRQLVHKWRSEEQAILVGTTTVLADNPRLDVRDWHGQNPVRIVLDRLKKIDGSYHVMDKNSTTIVITEIENLESSEHLIYENTIFDNRLAERICAILYKHNIQSVIIEGGTKTLETFINACIWDEARFFSCPILLKEGIQAPKISFIYKTVTIKNDDLKTIYNYD
jgi:diaminohydroxyphosphoribosylaminopyrimidine deaminase / 5-amino-6-(5-phosphoribosylamino)uracil reductase